MLTRQTRQTSSLAECQRPGRLRLEAVQHLCVESLVQRWQAESLAQRWLAESLARLPLMLQPGKWAVEHYVLSHWLQSPAVA